MNTAKRSVVHTRPCISTHKISAVQHIPTVKLLLCSGADEVNESARDELMALDARLRIYRRHVELINKGKTLASQVLAGLASAVDNIKEDLQQLEDTRNQIQKNMRIKVAL